MTPAYQGENLFLLQATDRHLEVGRLDDGSVYLHTPALVSASDARQIARGILAVLDGGFDRALSEDTLQFELARREAAARQPLPPRNLQPELDTL